METSTISRAPASDRLKISNPICKCFYRLLPSREIISSSDNWGLLLEWGVPAILGLDFTLLGISVLDMAILEMLVLDKAVPAMLVLDMALLGMLVLDKALPGMRVLGMSILCMYSTVEMHVLNKAVPGLRVLDTPFQGRLFWTWPF